MKTSICAALFFFCLIFSGCGKLTREKFKGKVVGDLNGEGIKNASIYLKQSTEHYNSDLGTHNADENGYYEFYCEVEHEYFNFEIIDPKKVYPIRWVGTNTDGKFQIITLKH